MSFLVSFPLVKHDLNRTGRTIQGYIVNKDTFIEESSHLAVEPLQPGPWL